MGPVSVLWLREHSPYLERLPGEPPKVDRQVQEIRADEPEILFIGCTEAEEKKDEPSCASQNRFKVLASEEDEDKDEDDENKKSVKRERKNKNSVTNERKHETSVQS